MAMLVQGSFVVIAMAVVFLAIAVREAGLSNEFLVWAVAASLIVIGITTYISGITFGFLGSGQFTFVGSTAIYLSISILVIRTCGLGTWTLMLAIASVTYFGVAHWLPKLRHIITPAAKGTTLILVAVSVIPFGVELLPQVPAQAEEGSGFVVAMIMAVSLLVSFVGLPSLWRSCALFIAISAGCVAAGLFRQFDLALLVNLPWFGLPPAAYTQLTFGSPSIFWTLLPITVMVAFVHAAALTGRAALIQEAKLREERSLDFNRIQGSLYASGIGVLLSALLLTVPTTTYSGLSRSAGRLNQKTGFRPSPILSALFVCVAFFPKITGLLLTLPLPVMGTCLILASVRLVLDGLSLFRRAKWTGSLLFTVVVAIVTGAVMQAWPALSVAAGYPWNLILSNSLSSGTVVFLILATISRVVSRRPKHLVAVLNLMAFRSVRTLLADLAKELKWEEAAATRLDAAGEEALWCIMGLHRERGEKVSRLILYATPMRQGVELEFVVQLDGDNLEDILSILDQLSETGTGDTISLRLLRHYATRVHHRKYQGIDVLTVFVES